MVLPGNGERRPAPLRSVWTYSQRPSREILLLAVSGEDKKAKAAREEEGVLMARGNGEGNIRKRKDGRWEARLTIGYRDGKARMKSVYGKTRTEAQQKLAKLQTDLQRGIAPTDDRQTVGQFLDRWLKVSAKGRVRPSTYVS